MIKRHVLAVASGVAVGIVLQESAWTGLDGIDPTASLNAALVSGPDAPGLMAPLLLAWALGGFSGSLMAALVGHHRAHGYIVGILLSASAWLVLHLAWPGAGGLLAITAVPVAAAVPGAGLAARTLPERRAQPLPPSVVTLRAGF